MARFWYAYNGYGDPILATSYNMAFNKPTCESGFIVCAIYSPGASNPTSPISARLRNYIANIQLAAIPQPDSSLNIKKYVYGRNS
ncbi:hypothetical protein [Pedobacter sp. WC2423]|uniref:hypothetical protein n=1 Tax=Pedobacter sp. WC2423 TaxID=3234142 RepID=UPI0034677EA1